MEKTIDECFSQIQNGANIKQGIKNGGFPITRIETISNDKFNRDKMGYAGITDASQYENYILEDNDLLMSHINSPQYLGRTVLYKKVENEIIIHGMNLLRLKANKEINPSYARYYFYGNKFRQQIVKITKKSVNQASFAVNDLKRIKMYLPEMESQNNIVRKLDIISKLIDFYNEILNKYDLLIKARFVEMFGSIHNSKIFVYYPLKEITIVCSGGTPNRDNKAYWESGTIPWVKTTELKNNRLTHVEEFITELGLEESSAKLVPSDTVLVAMYGQGKTRGMTGYLEIEATTNQACACILPTNKMNMIYLWKYFELSYDKLRELAKGGNQPNLNCTMIRDFNILVPPIELQNQYADFVRHVDKSRFDIKKSIIELEREVVYD